MFYHPYDSGNAAAIKHLIFWVSLFGMFALFIFLICDDAKIAQKEVSLKIDVRNKVNICLAKDEKIFEKEFFDF